jgi:hypothetical protein
MTTRSASYKNKHAMQTSKAADELLFKINFVESTWIKFCAKARPPKTYSDVGAREGGGRPKGA